MTKKVITNLPASVKAKLLGVSRKRGEDFNLTLSRYAGERFLYRLCQSEHAQRFILKGALLLTIIMEDNPYRPTHDIDLLGELPGSVTGIRDAFEAIFATTVQADGLQFNRELMEITEIRRQTEFKGVRVKMTALLERSRIPLQVDIGFGDVVTPAVRRVRCPTVLDLDAPEVFAYPIETILAEKLEAIVSLGMLTSRMKDFFDVYAVVTTFEIPGDSTRQAVESTFGRRNTAIPVTTPDVMGRPLATDATKQRQWAAFLQDIEYATGALTLEKVTTKIREFAEPVFKLTANDLSSRSTVTDWDPNTGWRERVGPGPEIVGDPARDADKE